MSRSLKGKYDENPPVGHATAWGPLGLGPCRFAGKDFWSGIIKRRRNRLPSGYGY